VYKDGRKFDEIKRRLAQANRVDFSLLPTIKSRAVRQVTKIWLCKTIIGPALWYGCERWILTKHYGVALDAFERKS
jgi:hypothetical protein